MMLDLRIRVSLGIEHRRSCGSDSDTLFLRENDETPSLLLALVAGLTWIRKWTIVVGSGRSLSKSLLAIADALKDEPINYAALTCEATAPPEGLPAMGKRWAWLYDNAGGRLDAI